MERQKLYTILIILFALGIALLVFNRIFNRDQVRPLLVEVIQNQETQAAMSQLVSSHTANFELQTLAASVSATTTSDSLTLREFYDVTYSKKIPKNEDAIIEQLEGTTVGFEDRYRFSLKEYLEKNLTALRQILSSTKDEALRPIIETAIVNQEAHLAQLKGEN